MNVELGEGDPKLALDVITEVVGVRLSSPVGEGNEEGLTEVEVEKVAVMVLNCVIPPPA